MKKQSIAGVLLILLSAIIFGSMPLFAHHLNQEGVNSPSLVFYRAGMALPFLGMLVKSKSEKLSVEAHSLKKILLLGLAGTLTPLLLYSAYQFMPTGIVTTVHFSYPVFVVLAGWIFFKKKPSLLLMISLALATLSLFFLLDIKNPTGHLGSTGFLLAFMSVVTYAFYTLYLDVSKLTAMDSNKLQFYMCLITVVFIVVYWLLTGKFSSPKSLFGWILTFIFSMVITFGGAIPFQLGVRMIGPQNSSILSTAEPITSLVIGVLMLNENIRWIQGVAIVLILVSTIIVAISAGGRRETV